MYKLFVVVLKVLFVENFDSDGERFKFNVYIFINVIFVDGVKVVFVEDVVRMEVFGDGFQFIEGKGDDIGVEFYIVFSVFQGGRSRRVVQI